MPPVSFSDEEINSITALASALAPPARSAFLRTVAGQLAAHPPAARGVGLTHRIAAEAQRDFLKNGQVAEGVAPKFRHGKWT